MNIVKLHAEKKTAEISLLTWEISPPALNTPFQVYRALVYGGEYEIVGNGIGTAFVAPIFIAFNPIAKQDPKKKKYSAMRQPISAIIATAMGFAINKPIADMGGTS